MNIILIGPRSVGKSTVGKLLVKRLGYEYIELDEIVDKRLHGIDQYCKNHGADSYREEESRILVGVLKRLPKNFVMCVGGGTVASQLHEASEQNVKELKKHGKLVYLNPSDVENKAIEILHMRELSRKGNQDLEHTKTLYRLRAPVYKRIKDLEIIVENKLTEEIVELILKLISSK